MRLRCHRCGRELPFAAAAYKCACGGPLEIIAGPTFELNQVREGEHDIWRYRAALPLPKGAAAVRLGEGGTPLVDARWADRPVKFKIESLNPTGSFKDRGAALLVAALRAAGIVRVVEDSSGNAGAALAAYAARAGLQATVYVPAHASKVKQAQIAVYGAKIVLVPGSRSAASGAVLAAVDDGAIYASHAYSPLYAHGLKTIAFELWEQCGWCAPGTIVVPLGHGGLVLGLDLGFGELLSAGLIERRPQLVGVQAEPCAPLAIAWKNGAARVESIEEGETVAGGVRIAAPPWGRQVLAAVRRSTGSILAIPDAETLAVQRRLAKLGFYVEPTSALAVAGLDRLHEGSDDGLIAPVVAVLTGSGFKSPRR